MKKKNYKLAKPFFQNLLKDKEIRILFEEEKAKTEIAHAVRAARLKANLTQTDLAKKIDTTQSVIARLESGSDKRVPSLGLLARIAAACGASFEFGLNILGPANLLCGTEPIEVDGSYICYFCTTLL